MAASAEVSSDADVFVPFDQCMFDAPSVKPTSLASNCKAWPEFFAHNRCSHPRETHKSLIGRSSATGFRTTVSMEYPLDMCRCMALMFAMNFRDLPAYMGYKQRAPPVSASFPDTKRWRLLFRADWTHEEHPNDLELKTIVSLGRHVATSKTMWGHGVLCCTDSLVSLGAIGKRRSSTPQLLYLCRHWASLRLACQSACTCDGCPASSTHPTALRDELE